MPTKIFGVMDTGCLARLDHLVIADRRTSLSVLRDRVRYSGIMRFLQVDVFAEAPYGGNPLAVFPQAEGLSARQMQSIAREMNLSETTFVMTSDANGYDVRIFTPFEELSFAGHPTIGTTWVLRYLGILRGHETTQRSQAGPTTVRLRGDLHWLEREETSLGERYELKASAIGLDAGDLGCTLQGVRLEPALASAGLTQLIVPLASVDSLARARPGWAVPHGVYCFTPTDGVIRARGFFPNYGIPEDPATGSAAAALGVYLAARIGPLKDTIEQGSEIGRPSVLHMECEPGFVRIGGRCELVATGELRQLP